MVYDKKTKKPFPTNSKELGSFGETLATEFFRALGAKEVCRNWRCAIGEIDLIVWDGRELVFVEVKSRFASRDAEQYLFSTIDRKKRSRLKRLASLYLYQMFWRRVPPHRIDAVGVIVNKSQDMTPIIRHLRGVVKADD